MCLMLGRSVDWFSGIDLGKETESLNVTCGGTEQEGRTEKRHT